MTGPVPVTPAPAAPELAPGTRYVVTFSRPGDVFTAEAAASVVGQHVALAMPDGTRGRALVADARADADGALTLTLDVETVVRPTAATPAPVAAALAQVRPPSSGLPTSYLEALAREPRPHA